MPRPSPYTDKQKAAILEAVKSAALAIRITTISTPSCFRERITQHKTSR
jgi:hypothetical protein